jgi:hypothetical protein
MNISIPDKLYKLIIMIGLFLIGYSFYKVDNSEKNYFIEVDKYTKVKDSLYYNVMIMENEFDKLYKASKQLSLEYDVKNPITKKDSLYEFNRIYKGPKQTIALSDTLSTIWANINDKDFKFNLLNKKLDFSIEKLKDNKRIKKQYFEYYGEIFNFGFLFLITGIFLWIAEHILSFKRSQIIEQEKKIYTFCQSCGKKFSSVLLYGANEDKSKNSAFCEKCFSKGKFINPELTKKEFMVTAIKETSKFSFIDKKLLKYRFKNLDRWKEDKY